MHDLAGDVRRRHRATGWILGTVPDSRAAWNVVPWYLPSGNRTANATAADVREAVPWLTRLIDLLPSLELVVPMAGARSKGGLSTRVIVSFRAAWTSLRPGTQVRWRSMEDHIAATRSGTRCDARPR